MGEGSGRYGLLGERDEFGEIAGNYHGNPFPWQYGGGKTEQKWDHCPGSKKENKEWRIKRYLLKTEWSR